MTELDKSKVAFIFPGQGSQFPGMAKDFYDNFKAAQETFEEADRLLGFSFSKLIFEGPADELTLTKNSQLAIFISSVAILRTLQDQFPDLVPVVCAGLSLGEYTALAASRRISFEDCLLLVQKRAAFMEDACAQNHGSMRVILGMPAESVEEAIATLNPPHPVWVANINCPGQVVIAGAVPALDLATKLLLERGAKRVIPLDVSGAFHSGLMLPAQNLLEPIILSTPFIDSSIDLVMNVSGEYENKLEKIRSCLIAQITGTVRWEKSIRGMEAGGVTAFIEIGCGGVLAGMNRKMVSVPTFSIGKVSDLEELTRVDQLV